jgi:hypothetical protein
VRRFDASLAQIGQWVGLNPDGTLLYTGGFGGEASVRDGRPANWCTPFTSHTSAEKSAPTAVVAVADGRVLLLDTATLTEQRRRGHAHLATLQFW